MANTQTIGGFQPVRSKVAKTQGRIVAMIAADRSSNTTNNAGDIYLGDAVSLSSGLLVPSYTGISGGVFGVAVGFGVLNSSDPLSVPLAFNFKDPSQTGFSRFRRRSRSTISSALRRTST